MPWSTSGRRASLPPNWDQIRQRILRRDGHRCRWLTNGHRCTRTATDVDHLGDRDDHHDNNLQSLCTDHHKTKTTHEAHAAMRARRATARHPVETHPGMR